MGQHDAAGQAPREAGASETPACRQNLAPLSDPAWSGAARDPKSDPSKMNMQPFDSTVYMNGWWDHHRAGGPEVWKQSFYQSPERHFGRTGNRAEIVYWGEDGAMSSPQRLGLIENTLKKSTKPGWEGQFYRDWYKTFDEYLTANHLRASFPTVDDLCQAMGVISIEHQGRKFEDTRICDLNDGYAINGWEDEIDDNHSAMVDSYRNPKADPAIMAYYNQPLYVAVKPRRQITPFPGSVVVDFYLINEKDLKGEFTLRVRATSRDGKEIFSKNLPVTAAGGDVFGQLIAENVEIPLRAIEGMNKIMASIIDAQGVEKASGHDEVLAVDWKSIPITGKGAIFENGSLIHDFLKSEKGIDVPLFDDTQGKLDWLVVGKYPNEPIPIPKSAFVQPDGKTSGVKVSFYAGQDFAKKFSERIDPTVDLKVASMATPDSNVPLIDNYSVRWEGTLLPPTSGDYNFALGYEDKARLWINGKQVLDESKAGGLKSLSRQFKVTLEAGKPVSFQIELLQKRNGARMQMLWQTPISEKISAAQVLERASRDGTTVLIVDRAGKWLDPVAVASGVPSGKTFDIGIAWSGGQYFVKSHPLFEGLPVNQGLNWPYQSVVGGERMGFEIQGGELVAGAWHSWPMRLGAAVSIFPVGQGRIILSSLDIVSQLDNPDTSAEVARRLFCNFLNFAAGKNDGLMKAAAIKQF